MYKGSLPVIGTTFALLSNHRGEFGFPSSVLIRHVAFFICVLYEVENEFCEREERKGCNRKLNRRTFGWGLAQRPLGVDTWPLHTLITLFSTSFKFLFNFSPCRWLWGGLHRFTELALILPLFSGLLFRSSLEPLFNPIMWVTIIVSNPFLFLPTWTSAYYFLFFFLCLKMCVFEADRNIKI